MPLTEKEQLQAWVDHRDKNAHEIRMLPYGILNNAKSFKIARLRSLAQQLVDACDEYERTTKPIAEWEAIVALASKEGK